MSTGLNRWLGPMPADRVQRRRGPADAMRRPTEPGCAVRPADCAAGETEPWAQIRNGRLAPRFAPGGPRRHSLGGGWWIRLRMGFCCGSIQRGGVNQARPPRMVTVQSCFSISWWWTGRAGPRCRGLFGRRRARIGCGGLGVITCSAPRSLRSSLVPRCDARSLSPSTRTAVLQPGQAQPRSSRSVRIRPSGHRGRTWSRIREHGGGGHGNTVGIRFRAPDRRTIRADRRWPRRGGADRQPEDSAAGWRHHPPWRRRAPVAGRSVHR